MGIEQDVAAWFKAGQVRAVQHRAQAGFACIHVGRNQRLRRQRLRALAGGRSAPACLGYDDQVLPPSDIESGHDVGSQMF